MSDPPDSASVTDAKSFHRTTKSAAEQLCAGKSNNSSLFLTLPTVRQQLPGSLVTRFVKFDLSVIPMEITGESNM